MDLPLLYSFRRCPYAMRARFALAYAGISYVTREVDLKNKPKSLLSISPKGTVPVLQLPNGDVIDESIKIVEWALQEKGDAPLSETLEVRAQAMIQFNDKEFTKIVHRYKYRDLYPHEEFNHNEEKLHRHFSALNDELAKHQFLLTDTMTKVDIAIFPFVRQVVGIHPEKFALSSLQHLMQWLTHFLQSPYFLSSMTKYPVWQET